MEGATFIAMPAYVNGDRPLVGSDIAQRPLRTAPIVLWDSTKNAQQQISPLQDPFNNIPSAFIEADARGVLAIRSIGDPSLKEFLVRVLMRTHAGETLAEGLRNERMLWLQQNSSSVWLREIVAYE
jgi:hypothetical protein